MSKLHEAPTVSEEDFANAELVAVAKAIWKIKPDCERNLWPLDGWEDRDFRRYPHHPSARLDLCFDYAKAAIAAMRSLSDAESLSREDNRGCTLGGNLASGSDDETGGALGPASPQHINAWRPIETAPRDGTTILIFGWPSDLIIDGNALTTFKRAAVYSAAWDEIDQAFCLSGGSWLGPFVEPTAWQARPAPPVEPEKIK